MNNWLPLYGLSHAQDMESQGFETKKIGDKWFFKKTVTVKSKNEKLVENLIRKLLFEENAWLPVTKDAYEQAQKDPTREVRKECDSKGENCKYFARKKESNTNTNTGGQTGGGGNVTLTLPDWAAKSPCLRKSTAYAENGEVKHKNEKGEVTTLYQNGTAKKDANPNCTGKWECNGEETYITISCNETSGGGSVNSGSEGSNDGEYPPCVGDQQQAAGFLYGNATDLGGALYTVQYYPERKVFRGTKGYLAYITPKKGTQPIIGFYRCAGERLIILDENQVSYTASENSAQKTITTADLAVVLDYYNDIPDLFILTADKTGIQKIKTDVFQNAINTIKNLVESGYRGNSIGRFYEALPSMKKFLQKENPDQTLLDLIDNAEKAIAVLKQKYTNWDDDFDSRTDPSGTKFADYKKAENVNVAPFDPAKFIVYVNKQMSGNAAEKMKRQQNTQAKQEKSGLTSEACKNWLATYLGAAGMRNFIPKDSRTTTTGSGIPDSEIEDWKTQLVQCNDAGFYDDNKDWKKGRDQLRYAKDPKYKIDW